jgi:DNA-binding MarR family transcriptional regulator
MASHHPSSPDPLERSPTPTDSVPPTQIEAVRRFNRFYTGQIGLLEESLLESPFTLTEGRILFEVAHQVETTATDLAGRLRLDRGYLSRILASFHERGLLDRRTSEEDGRVQLLTLTPLGKKAFEEINAASEREIRELLHGVPVAQRARLVDAMHTIRSILQDGPSRMATATARLSSTTGEGVDAGEDVVERHDLGPVRLPGVARLGVDGGDGGLQGVGPDSSGGEARSTRATPSSISSRSQRDRSWSSRRMRSPSVGGPGPAAGLVEEHEGQEPHGLGLGEELHQEPAQADGLDREVGLGSRRPG